MTRLVIYGAGAIGGVMGGRLHGAGNNVLLIARGAHHDAIAAKGLSVQSPRGLEVHAVPVVDHPAKANLAADDIVLLTMKSQDTPAALAALAATAPPEISIVCAQNGVENERAALRSFPNVHGMFLYMPTEHGTPGLVVEYGASIPSVPHPVTGVLDLGRYPTGTNSVDEKLSAILSKSGFASSPRADIMAWKHRKLVQSVGTAVDVVMGPGAGSRDITKRARTEALECLKRAGIPVVSEAEYQARYTHLQTLQEKSPTKRPSTWQSLERGLGSIETDYLNGEIVLLGRLHGVPTPVNALLQRLANDLARRHAKPGTFSEAQFLELLDRR